MTESFKRIGLAGKTGDPSVAPTLYELVRLLRDSGREVFLDHASKSHLGESAQRAMSREELAGCCDLIIAVGGDGTLLDTGRTVGPRGIPLLGINQGRLGFMVDVSPEDMHATLEDVLAGRYIREERIMLTARIQRGGEELGPFNALNDVVVHTRGFARLLEFDTSMNGDFISHHRADGMIVATPTGSTAYALSGGGPVLHPAMDAALLVPICPHTLSDRPMVVDGQARITIEIGGGNDTQATASCDGQNSWSLKAGDTVQVSQAANCLNLIHPPTYDYFAILRDKLHWGRGQKPETSQSGQAHGC